MSRLTTVLIAGLVTGLAALPLTAEDAADIADRSDARGESEYFRTFITLTITAPSGDERVISAQFYQKRRSDQREDRLFVFTYPPDVRDMALLVHSQMESGDDSMWIYLPAVERVKRVDLGASGGGTILGSDFTFRDLVSRDHSEYVFEFLPSDDDDRYVLDVRGRTPELQRTFGYSREEHTIRKENLQLERILFFDLAGDPLKELIVEDEHEADGYAFPSLVRMLNHQTGHVSRLTLEEMSFTDEIPDRFFTQRALRQR
ncbi:MAG: outer membrane lipoprotein-sorting protein [Spirochaetaceae bacterium]|nr:outer membrane lipoprotein-sorting protein [Spirochaetaceae bacterium]